MILLTISWSQNVFFPQNPFLVMQKCISCFLNDYCSAKNEELQNKLFFASK